MGKCLTAGAGNTASSKPDDVVVGVSLFCINYPLYKHKSPLLHRSLNHACPTLVGGVVVVVVVVVVVNINFQLLIQI